MKLGVHQGCVLSQDLFTLYGENILNELCDNAGITVGGYNINIFSCVDDTMFVSNSKEKLQHLLNIIVNERKRERPLYQHQENRINDV